LLITKHKEIGKSYPRSMVVKGQLRLASKKLLKFQIIDTIGKL